METSQVSPWQRPSSIRGMFQGGNVTITAVSACVVFLVGVWPASAACEQNEAGTAPMSQEELARWTINIPPEEAGMTDRQVLEAIAEGVYAWPKYALRKRASKRSPEEMAKLVEEVKALALSLQYDDRYETFVVNVADALSPSSEVSQALRRDLLSRSEWSARRAYKIPREEVGMTDRQVLEALALAYDPTAWPKGALTLRARKRSPEELARLVEEVKAVARSMERDHRYRAFVSEVADVLPPPLAVPLLRDLLLDGTDSLDRSAFCSGVSWVCREVGVGRRKPDEATLALVADILHDLYLQMDEELKQEEELNQDRHQYHFKRETQSVVLGVLGVCGEAGLDRLLELPWRSRAGFFALGTIGTQRALHLLCQVYRDRPDTDKEFRQVCLKALSSGGLQDKPEAIQELVRKELVPYFSDENPSWRAGAAGIAAVTKDTYFLPYVRELASKDPFHTVTFRVMNVDGKSVEGDFDMYPVREAAERAINSIIRADPTWQAQQMRLRRIEQLEKHLAYLEKTIPKAPIEAAKESLERDHAETLQKLEGLRAEVAAAEPLVPKP